MDRKRVKPGAEFHPRKRLGQHFLVDRNAMEKVIRIADVSPEDVVLEIGSGRGEMTLTLAQKSRKVIAVEIDPMLAVALTKKTANLENIEVIQGDALRVDLEGLCQSRGPRLKVVANLPYQISTPLLMRLIDARHLFSCMVLMFQKEVALRIVAKSGTKDYGVLSVFIQLHATPTIEMFLPPPCFSPRPKVDSAVVRFLLHERPKVEVGSEKVFRQVVRACFGHRRKTLRNALRSILPEWLTAQAVGLLLEDLHIEPNRRAETLSLDEFARLTQGLIPHLAPSGWDA
jgi:16S rRNA (adenine1518-N6/adenine1519-N6)-dimethyltransferase